MRVIGIIFATLCALASSASAETYLNEADKDLTPDARRTISTILQDSLRDADAAKISAIRTTSNGVFCGEMNTKNAFGGYLGFKPFAIFDHQGKKRLYLFTGTLPEKTIEGLDLAMAGINILQHTCGVKG